MVRKEVLLLVRSEHLTLLEPHKYTPLQASFDAFLLSKQAARCTAKTLVHYRYTVGNMPSDSVGWRPALDPAAGTGQG